MKRELRPKYFLTFALVIPVLLFTRSLELSLSDNIKTTETFVDHHNWEDPGGLECRIPTVDPFSKEVEIYHKKVYCVRSCLVFIY